MDAHTHTRHLTRESSRVCLWNKPVKMFRRSISVGINFITVWKSRLHCGWPGKKLLIHRETFSHEIVLYKLKTSLFHVQRFLLITNSTFFSKKKTLQVILNRQVTKMKKKNYLRARCTPVIPERKSLCTFLKPFEVKRKKAKICSQKKCLLMLLLQSSTTV